MGKKDKKVDAAKLQAKKARQAMKQQKTENKRAKKEIKAGGDVDIEAILAEYSVKEKSKTSVSVSIVAQPSRRSNFSMTALSNGEILMFGGEYCDGESTEVYNDLYRWNVEKNEWKHIESLNTPPPRCSHQAVLFNDKIYMFGGEYATLDQFYHYRDFWELDLKTNTWTELICTGDIPAARSGHRMLVWRNFLILFGGFYEAMREVRWYNDLYIFSFQEQKWNCVSYKPHSSIPKPRSGVLMFLHTSEDVLYIYGGYSKQKEGSKHEGRIHEDMWMLPLKPCLSGGKSSNLDFSKLAWQKIARKGDYPSPRCGVATGIYKNKVLVFGGVCDHEGPQHSLVSSFYDDLFAFDMERKRWYKLGLKVLKAKQPRTNVNKDKKLESKTNGDSVAESSGNDDDEEIIDDEIDSNCNQGELFGYIDETGAVVYIDLDASEQPPPQTDNQESLNSEVVEHLCSTLTATHVFQEPSSSSSVVMTDCHIEAIGQDFASTHRFETNEKHFVDLEKCDQPCARFNPSILIKGNTMFLYGGVTENGDTEVTLDDCWSLDINKRDQWRKVLNGTMSSIVWKGGNDDETNSQEAGSDNDDSDENSDDSDDSEGHESDNEERIVSPQVAVKSGGRSRKAEMESLRTNFDVADEFRTPKSGETLREFYSRTAEYWSGEVIARWQQVNNKEAVLSEKDIKREAFASAETRYQELLPLLSRLDELESEQIAEENWYNKNTLKDHSKTSSKKQSKR